MGTVDNIHKCWYCLNSGALFVNYWPPQSKYIARLKKVADKRKLEQELVYERKVQREMEQEGIDPDKTEAYLTGAYRQKLIERKEMEEELRKEEEIDSKLTEGH